MQNRFTLFRRGAVCYCEDRSTGRQQSLRTRSEAVNQPLMNLALAKAYLSAQDPKPITGTWADVMERFCNRLFPKVPSEMATHEVGSDSPAVRKIKRRGNLAAVMPAAVAAATLVKVGIKICSPERIRSKLQG